MNYTNRFSILVLTCMCWACAPMGSDANLARRVEEQDMQLRQMQPQQADTWNEVQTMREEINQLKSQLANMNRGNAPSAATPDAAPQVSGATPQVSEPVTGIVPNPVNAPGSSAYRYTASVPPLATPSVDTSLGVPSATAAQGNYGLPADQSTPAIAPDESNWGKADPVAAEPKPKPVEKKDIALALFEAGQNDFKARRYGPAERSFQDFIKNYPKHAKIPDAQYYLGECFFGANNFARAALAFDDVIRKYPKSSVLPAAYLKEGIAFSKMGKPDAARLRLNELIKKFPTSPEAKRAQAFLKANK